MKAKSWEEGKISLCFSPCHEGKYSVNPSVKCARESINYQSDLSNLNQRID
ncbi:MAG TPA: hypothetical protein VJK54_11580 [Chthoniobacterales bacterium]|nr:hypothetical protein [Chthoniobacterales bacterium]